MERNKHDRFQEFVNRLDKAPNARSHDAAFDLLTSTLNEVEDEFTDIPYRPEYWQTDGRMYPPEEDSARAVEGRPDVVRYRHKGHNTFIRDNGAIVVREITGQVRVEKPGADGRGVEL